MGQLAADDQHGQGDGDIAQVVHRGLQHRRQLDLQQEDGEAQGHADDAGIQDELSQPQGALAVLQVADPRRPEQGSEDQVVGRAVEKADVPHQGGQQRVAHKAAVGEDGAVHQHPLAPVVRVPDAEVRHSEVQPVDQNRGRQHPEKAVDPLRRGLHLKGPDEHTGQGQVDHHVGEGRQGGPGQQLCFTQAVAGDHHEKQRDDLAADGDEVGKHRNHRSFKYRITLGSSGRTSNIYR